MKPRWAGTLQKDIDDLAKGLGTLLVDSFHYEFPAAVSDEAMRR